MLEKLSKNSSSNNPTEYDGLSNYGGGDSIGYAYPASPFISQSHLSYQPHIRLPIPSVTAPPPSAYSTAPSNYSNSSSHRYYLSASQLAHLGPVRSGLPSSIVAEHHDQATAPRISLSSLGSTFRCQSVVSEITNSAYSRSNMNSIDPPDEQILYELERLLESCDLMTTTKKQIREQLSAVFGVRLHHRKAFINGHIDEYLRRAHG